MSVYYNYVRSAPNLDGSGWHGVAPVGTVRVLVAQLHAGDAERRSSWTVMLRACEEPVTCCSALTCQPIRAGDAV